jgi:hypothetical protein
MREYLESKKLKTIGFYGRIRCREDSSAGDPPTSSGSHGDYTDSEIHSNL